MTDIKLKILDLLRTDSTLQGLLGGTVQDPRVYPYYQGEAVVTKDKPAYITFANTATPEATGAVEEPVYSVAIWGLSWSIAESVRDRVRALLHKQVLITAAPTSRRMYTKIIGDADSYQVNTKFAGRTLQLRAGWSTV